MSKRATLFVTFEQEGFHRWADAPLEYAYLGVRHRHLFKIRVEVDSSADGARSIEFHELTRHCKTVFRDIARRGTMYDYGDMSCEQMADAMALRLSRSYGTVVGVSVSEDGECGAIVYADVEDDVPVTNDETHSARVAHSRN